MSASLPEGFADLSRFGPRWFGDTEQERHRVRTNSERDDMIDLYNSILPRLDDICTELDQHPLEALPESHANLLNLALSFMEVSLAVESFDGAPKVPYGFDTDRWEVHF